MRDWRDRPRFDPLPALLAAEDPAPVWSVRIDLLGEATDAQALWKMPATLALLRNQRADGSWRFSVARTKLRSQRDYDQLPTYEALLSLVEQHHLDRRRPAIGRAAEFLLGFQADEGDLRGIYGSQHSPNYTAAILALLVEVGLSGDPRVEAGMRAFDRLAEVLSFVFSWPAIGTVNPATSWGTLAVTVPRTSAPTAARGRSATTLRSRAHPSLT